MKQEIERKYAVNSLPKDLKIEKAVNIEQAFIYRDENTHIRIRKIQETYPNNNTKYIYTVKTKGDIQYNNKYDIGKKYEIENEIEKEEYEKLKPRKISNIINKTRIVIPIQENLKVEIDVYKDYLEGLLTAEVEFSNEEEARNFQEPNWFGEELGHKELSNRKLSEMTREQWQEKVTKEMIENNKKIINQLRKEVGEMEVGGRKILITTYADLEIYKESYKLALEIYIITKKFPKDELYSLTSQIRRASTSITLNIVEGYGRLSKEEFKRFLKISLGSTNETKTLLEFSKDLNYINEKEYIDIKNRYEILSKMIYSMIKKWN